MFDTVVARGRLYTEHDQSSVSAVEDVHHTVIPNMSVKALHDFMYVLLTRFGWKCHNPGYETSCSVEYNDWIARNMAGTILIGAIHLT